MFDVAGLRVMRAIAEQGSFTAAANSLGYTQPAISQMVRRLEQRTGTALVERSGRTVRLTEAGRVFLERARLVVRKYAACSRGRGGGSTTWVSTDVTVPAPPTAGPGWPRRRRGWRCR